LEPNLLICSLRSEVPATVEKLGIVGLEEEEEEEEEEEVEVGLDAWYFA
jgi:hypothetical protein